MSYPRRFVRKILPSRLATLLLLIILPSILATIIAIENYYKHGVSGIFIIALALIVLNYIVVAQVYDPYHVNRYAEYFTKPRAIEAVKEYHFSKKLFILVVATTIFLLFLNVVLPYGQLSEEETHIFNHVYYPILIISALATLYLASRFVGQYSQKDFGFYLARAYYMVSFREEDSIEKFKYLTLMMDTYNNFLERNLKLEIKDITHIYSMFISASSEQKIKISESIGKALEKDKLELARQLAELSSLPDKEKFLVKERPILNQRFKEVLTVIIPAFISVGGFIIAILAQLEQLLQ